MEIPIKMDDLGVPPCVETTMFGCSATTKMHVSKQNVGEPPKIQWFEHLIMFAIKGHTSKLVCMYSQTGVGALNPRLLKVVAVLRVQIRRRIYRMFWKLRVVIIPYHPNIWINQG